MCTVRSSKNIRYSKVLTIFEVRDRLQNVAVCVERSRSTDAIGGIPARIQDNLGVNEIPGGNSLVQSLAESRSRAEHMCERMARTRLAARGVYTVLCGVETPYRDVPGAFRMCGGYYIISGIPLVWQSRTSWTPLDTNL